MLVALFAAVKMKLEATDLFHTQAHTRVFRGLHLRINNKPSNGAVSAEKLLQHTNVPLQSRSTTKHCRAEGDEDSVR